MTARLFLLFPFSLLFITQLCSQIESTFETDSITRILYNYAEDDVPGIAVGVVKDGAILYENYIGYANLTHRIKVSEKTRFNIASTAKQFTALMILQLSIEGKLSLEDDIRKYLPTLYPKVKEDIKIRHLLNHSSGIRDYVELLSLKGEIWWKQMGLDNDDILELIAQQEDLGFDPGSQYAYSNTGYVLLAKIVEAVTDEKFTDYSKNFFQQMGMKETSFVERYMGIIPNRAEPYYDWGNGKWMRTPTITKTCGEGFLFTTLQDQLTYEIALQNADKSNTLLTKSQQAIPNSEITSYGFGLELSDWADRRAVHHSGATYGYHAQMIRFQDEKLTIFVMSNNGNLNSYRIADAIADFLLPEVTVKKQIEYDSRYYETADKTDPPTILGQYLNSKGKIIRIVQEEEKTYWKKENGGRIAINREATNQYAISFDTTQKIRFYEDEMVLFEPNSEVIVYRRDVDSAPSWSDLEGSVGDYFNSELEVGFAIKRTEANQLILTFSKQEEEESIEILNSDKLTTGNYVLSIQRDAFNRVQAILLTYGRAKNIRFQKQTNLLFQSKIVLEDGSIQVTNIGASNGQTSDILLTRNDADGNEVWFKKFGGKSYDLAHSILATADGYLIIGSTSSYGNGNYDVFIIKTDKEGKKQWQNTFGGHFNEYGYVAEKTKNGYLIKGTMQQCTDEANILEADCTTNVYLIHIDRNGRMLSEEIREEMVE